MEKYIGFVLLCLLLVILPVYLAYFRALDRFFKQAQKEYPELSRRFGWSADVSYSLFTESRDGEMGGRPISRELTMLRRRAAQWLYLGASLFMGFLFIFLAGSLIYG